MMGKRNFANVDAAQGSATEAEDLEPHTVLAAALVAVQVTLGFKRPQNVAGGTLWHLQLAADLGVAEAFRLLGYRLQHGQSPFYRNRRRFVIGGHAESLW